MAESTDPFTDVQEFEEDDAGYSWWRDANPGGFILALRPRKPPLLHRADCGDVDRDLHARRLKARGSRQLCATMKAALRAWVKREMPDQGLLLARCPRCEP